jgi:hypothetical protein
MPSRSVSISMKQSTFTGQTEGTTKAHGRMLLWMVKVSAHSDWKPIWPAQNLSRLSLFTFQIILCNLHSGNCFCPEEKEAKGEWTISADGAEHGSGALSSHCVRKDTLSSIALCGCPLSWCMLRDWSVPIHPPASGTGRCPHSAH